MKSSGELSRGDEGASAVEYSMILAAIAAMIVNSVSALGGVVRDLFSDTSTCLQNPVASSCPGSNGGSTGGDGEDEGDGEEEEDESEED